MTSNNVIFTLVSWWYWRYWHSPGGSTCKTWMAV